MLFCYRDTPHAGGGHNCSSAVEGRPNQHRFAVQPRLPVPHDSVQPLHYLYCDATVQRSVVSLIQLTTTSTPSVPPCPDYPRACHCQSECSLGDPIPQKPLAVELARPAVQSGSISAGGKTAVCKTAPLASSLTTNQLAQLPSANRIPSLASTAHT